MQELDVGLAIDDILPFRGFLEVNLKNLLVLGSLIGGFSREVVEETFRELAKTTATSGSLSNYFANLR